MDQQTPSYRKEFLQSPHHAVFGLLTLGLGFLSGEPLPFIVGTTLYSLGWIYLPDLGFFKRWVDRRFRRQSEAADAQKLAEFMQRRQALLNSLTPTRREKYAALSNVCRDIERASGDNLLNMSEANSDPRLRKLDELMWTYLRLLSIEESLLRFLETEQRENLPVAISDAEAELSDLNAQLEKLKAKGQTPALETKQRYINSRADRLEVLKKRCERTEQAQGNLDLAVSEQERLDQQIKLIRADAIAARNTEALTARIDATVQHLDQTNRWLSQLDEFKDLVADMPATESRLGYEISSAGPTASPPIIQNQQPRKREAIRQR